MTTTPATEDLNSDAKNLNQVFFLEDLIERAQIRADRLAIELHHARAELTRLYNQHNRS